MVLSDALSRRPDHHPSEEQKPILDTLLPPEKFVLAIKIDPEEGMYDEALRKKIIERTAQETAALEILNRLTNPRDNITPEGWELRQTKEGTMLLYKGRIYVPDDQEIKKEITKTHHDEPTTGHPGQQATRLLVQRTYFWPGMTRFINQYVKGCPKCQQNKINRRPSKPPLIPIEPSAEPRPFSRISMDLITDLPRTGSYDSIFVIVDQGLSKGVILTPCNKEITAEQVGDLLYEKLLTKYGRPNKIISDWDPRFMAGSFQEALKRMGIKSAPSTAFHPQTDGATERVNQEIQAYLSIFCTYNPENWAERLPMAEFTHNSRTHAQRQKSPFELLIGYNPEAIPTAMGEYAFPTTEQRLKNMEAARSEALAAHELSAASMKERLTREWTPFKKNDRVWLDSRNLKLPYQSKKIAPKREGPFRIKEVLSPVNYRLKLPEHWRIHDVFHATLLSPFFETEEHGPAHPPPVPEIIDGQEEFEVDAILKHKNVKGKTFYLLRWKDQPISEDSWQPEEDLEHSQELLAEYWAKRKGPRKKTKRTKRTTDGVLTLSQLNCGEAQNQSAQLRRTLESVSTTAQKYRNQSARLRRSMKLVSTMASANRPSQDKRNA
ncbi:hypothetical protein H1R20_g11592, partial [Candolleomyces eurysporus]